ncbi:hypothetical protein ACQE3E_17370 [Methylomonas sp. MED-D]|uniref:hypothetical protein n=1 Tax=unclassified Methylomonas TaxID=2608980 RepID=UPI0028A53C3D|nr:hypothetical protein [Methylomonas sp. MV1]MDT4330874.1 hypothetical protein [Methylomonas sp. MV1]
MNGVIQAMGPYREPTGEDISDLLLRFAPKDILEAVDLTEDNKDEFIDSFDSGRYRNGYSYKTDITALALYYSNINAVNHIKYIDYIENESLAQYFYINPGVIYSLIQFVKSEEFYEVNKLKDDIDAGDLRKKDEIIKQIKEELKRYKSGPKAKSEGTSDKWTPVKKDFYDYMNINPESKVEEARKLILKPRIGIKDSGFKIMPTDKTLRTHLPYPNK